MTQTDGDRKTQREGGAEKDERYSRSVDCGQQETVSGHEREAIDYEREAHQPQKARDRTKRRAGPGAT